MSPLLKCIAVLCAASIVRASPKYDEFLRAGQRLLIQCHKQSETFDSSDEGFLTSVSRMKECLRSSLVDSLDELVTAPEIPINNYITLVSMNNTAEEFTSRSEPDENLLTTVANKLYSLINTHNVELNLAAFDGTEGAGQVEGRRRRFRKAFPMMVAGFMLMASFLVPLGFQFMAMIGGKALLLSKLAFFSAMYSGYRRVTTDLDFHHHHPEAFHNQLSYHLRRADSIQPPNIPPAYQYTKN